MKITILKVCPDGKIEVPSLNPGTVVALVQADAGNEKFVTSIVQASARRGKSNVTVATVTQSIPLAPEPAPAPPASTEPPPEKPEETPGEPPPQPPV